VQLIAYIQTLGAGASGAPAAAAAAGAARR